MSRETARYVVREQLEEAAIAHQVLARSTSIADRLVTWGQRCSEALERGGTIFFAGNGGSFADAQHLAAELTGKLGRLRRPLAGIALGANSSSMTAIGNDFSYSEVFAREFTGLARPESIVIALSTSGNSPNILALADAAEEYQTPMFVFTGADGGVVASRNEVIRVPSHRTERIQEMHILLGHTLCLLIEEFLGLFEVEAENDS